MRIAISSQSNSLDSPVDPRFGRTAGFVIYDTETNEQSWADNKQNLTLAQGAGLQTAQNVAMAGAKAVITGHMGPKAFMALQKGGVEIYLFTEGSVSEAIAAYKDGKLAKADEADKQGHW